MNKLLPISSIVLFLSGCVTSDIMNNQYPSIVATPAGDLSGVWTGSLGPYTSTLKIKSDGNGYSCYSWNDKQAIGRIKYNGNVIYFQEGSKLDVLSKTATSLHVNSPYYMGKEYTYTKDENLTQASPYCEKEIKNLD